MASFPQSIATSILIFLYLLIYSRSIFHVESFSLGKNSFVQQPNQVQNKEKFLLLSRQPPKNNDFEGKKISNKRRNQLGIPEDASEYDLDEALRQNTNPLITKVVAGSFILVVIALLVAGVIIPSLTDYGEGVCNPIKTAGRC